VRKVLEIGSGTGQHAVHFAAHLPHLIWQPSDLAENLPGIELWRAEAARSNLLPALALDVNQPQWPDTGADGVFSANTLHIVSWSEVRLFFAGVGRVLPPGGVLAVYGPFNYRGRHSSDSNARFDRMLRSQDPRSGIRDFEAVDALAAEQHLALQRDVPMPANNRTLVWRRG
jgi:cyclopropane fatty-acyl-phospholipid synthase-like methyltransferase